MKVIETCTGSRRIRGMPVATPNWSPFRVTFSEAMNDIDLDVMDDSDDGVEKKDDKIEENITVETPAVTVTGTVDTPGISPPLARTMTFTG